MRKLLYLVGILFVAVVLYAIEITNRNEALQETAHAHYTNELVNASEKMTELSSAILQVQLLSDPQASSDARQEVWRLSSELRNAMTKVPIDQGLSSDLMRYFAKIGEQSMQEESNWRGVSQNLQLLEEEWRVATAKFLNNESSFDTWEQHIQNSGTSFDTLAKSVRQYQDTDFPLTASETDYQKKKELATLADKEVTKEQAVQVIKQHFPQLAAATFTVSVNGEDAVYPFYHIQFVRGARLGYADITKKGGHLLSFLLERPVGKQQLTQQEAKGLAATFLKNAGYTDVVYREARENHEAWHLVFSREVNGAIVYPDSIQIKVAKDEKEILGINAMEYIQKEQLPETDFQPLDLSTIFAADVKMEPITKMYTENDQFEIIACYEVIATQYGETFRIVIDASTQEIIQIEQLL